MNKPFEDLRKKLLQGVRIPQQQISEYKNQIPKIRKSAYSTFWGQDFANKHTKFGSDLKKLSKDISDALAYQYSQEYLQHAEIGKINQLPIEDLPEYIDHAWLGEKSRLRYQERLTCQH